VDNFVGNFVAISDLTGRFFHQIFEQASRKKIVHSNQQLGCQGENGLSIRGVPAP
jgi:hypothetical protein